MAHFISNIPTVHLSWLINSLIFLPLPFNILILNSLKNFPVTMKKCETIRQPSRLLPINGPPQVETLIPNLSPNSYSLAMHHQNQSYIEAQQVGYLNQYFKAEFASLQQKLEAQVQHNHNLLGVISSLQNGTVSKSQYNEVVDQNKKLSQQLLAERNSNRSKERKKLNDRIENQAALIRKLNRDLKTLDQNITTVSNDNQRMVIYVNNLESQAVNLNNKTIVLEKENVEIRSSSEKEVRKLKERIAELEQKQASFELDKDISETHKKVIKLDRIVANIHGRHHNCIVPLRKEDLDSRRVGNDTQLRDGAMNQDNDYDNQYGPPCNKRLRLDNIHTLTFL